MSTKKTNQNKSNNKHTKKNNSIIKFKIIVLSVRVHVRNIHQNGLFIVLLNSIYNNIAIAQDHEHIHVQKANKLSKLLMKTNKPNIFPQNNMLSTIIKKDTCVKMVTKSSYLRHPLLYCTTCDIKPCSLFQHTKRFYLKILCSSSF